MKSYQNSFNEHEYYITPSEMIEFIYCKRYTYFMKCLGIRQYEEKRYKVQKGREIHEKRARTNADYLRIKQKVQKKEINISLVSRNLQIRGKIDEILMLEGGTMAPLDYKYAKYNEKIYKTLFTQMVMYALMIEEVYDKIVNRGYIVYCRDVNLVKMHEITEKDKKEVIKNINEFKLVLQGVFPKATGHKSRCIDCCYKNICIK
ncbi:MAG: CRISPR-associated protein Cas4 [Clostridiales bacterium]|nr:CRISPR-associated protein Cas4 [Clostridiales bacterium]